MNFLDVYRFFMRWEGGLSRDYRDSASKYPCPVKFNGESGWHTNKGVTYATYVAYFGKDNPGDFFKLTDEQLQYIFIKGYWDKVKGSEIKSIHIAACLVSWAWGSGSKSSIKAIQKLVGTKVDGVIGNKTIEAINSADEQELFDKWVEARRKFFISISKEGTPNTAFRRGWLRRLEDFDKKFNPKNS